MKWVRIDNIYWTDFRPPITTAPSVPKCDGAGFDREKTVGPIVAIYESQTSSESDARFDALEKRVEDSLLTILQGQQCILHGQQRILEAIASISARVSGAGAQVTKPAPSRDIAH
jgi:hypothetical protein